MKKKKEKKMERINEDIFFFLFLFNIYFYKIENILLLYFLIKN